MGRDSAETTSVKREPSAEASSLMCSDLSAGACRSISNKISPPSDTCTVISVTHRTNLASTWCCPGNKQIFSVLPSGPTFERSILVDNHGCADQDDGWTVLSEPSLDAECHVDPFAV